MVLHFVKVFYAHVDVLLLEIRSCIERVLLKMKIEFDGNSGRTKMINEGKKIVFL